MGVIAMAENITISCPVCENPIEIGKALKEGTRFTCPRCYVQLALYRRGGKWILGCAVCKEENFDPENCEDCERRRERKRNFEQGILRIVK
jgi:primosomal protein N'